MTTQKAIEFALEACKNLGWMIAGALLTGAWENRTRLWNAMLCGGPFRFASVRISAACLVRIEIDGNYLLVRGNRIRDQFQPVGGVYKYMPHAKGRLEELKVKTDKNFPIDQDSKDDLRIRVPGGRVPAVLRWFDKSCDRECGPWREFSEEMIASGLVSGAAFPHAQFRYVKRYERHFHWSPELRTFEILVFDVYELVPNAEQETELRRLLKTPGPDYAFVTEERIRRRGFQPGAYPEERIARHALWML